MPLAVFASLVGSALQSATGFGFALVASPVLFAVLEPGEAITALCILSAALSLLVLASERRERHVVARPLGVALLWSLPGLVAGVLLLRAVSKPALQVAVGAVVVLAAAVHGRAARPTRTAARRAAVPAWETAAAGAATGVLSTTTAVSGPPLLIWLERMGASPGETRDTLAAGFLVLTVPSALALLAAGELRLGEVGAGELALLLAAVAVGRALGRWAFVRLDAVRFRRAGLALALLAGAASVVAGLLG